jgi:hypothetical protein
MWRPKLKKANLFFCILFLFTALFLYFPQQGKALVPDRRKEQFPDEFAWYLIPFPYSYPGVGNGIMAMASASNILGTRADVLAAVITGDVGGSINQIGDVFIIPDYLYVEGFIQNLDKATFQNYESRGMNTEKDDFSFIEVTELYSASYQINLTFWERRLEAFYFYENQKATIPRIRNSEGELIADLVEPFKQENSANKTGFTLDLTDDRQDPRAGMRYKAVRLESPNQDIYSPDYYRLNHTLEFYIPIGQLSTWAFHAFRSDAVVTKQGATDRATLLELVGLTCETGDTECEQTQEDLIDQFTDMNKNGTSTSLGGLDRLRSYGSGRFSGAHTQYFSTEFRLNLTEEFTPFDYWIWSDTRTGVQAAMFYETGSVAELEADLGKENRSSIGAGLRMVTGSGFVYRFDISTGDEGTVPVIWFFYPW